MDSVVRVREGCETLHRIVDRCSSLLFPKFLFDERLNIVHGHLAILFASNFVHFIEEVGIAAAQWAHIAHYFIGFDGFGDVRDFGIKFWVIDYELHKSHGCGDTGLSSHLSEGFPVFFAPLIFSVNSHVFS